jgi:hypothetical protein
LGVLTGARFSGKMFRVPLPEAWHHRLPELEAAAFGAFGPLLLAGALGLLVLVRSRPSIGLMTLTWAMATVAFVLSYQASDWLTMLLPAWVLVGLWSVVGLDRTVRALGQRGRRLPVLVATALPAMALVTGYARADRSHVDPQADVDTAVRAVSDHSIIFTADNGTRHLFSYRLLPDSLGARRDVWASRGTGWASEADPPTYRIRAYCAPEPGPWVWPSQERAIAPSVARGLNTYLYGTRYAQQVRASGFRVTNVAGKLYRFRCTRR